MSAAATLAAPSGAAVQPGVVQPGHATVPLPSLQMLRAIAALLVVMYHTQAIFGARAGLTVLDGVFSQGSRGVDLFFVLSGFVITYVHRRDWGTPARLGTYLFNRASRIYPSVWIMSALAIAAYLAGMLLSNPVGMGAADQSARLGAWNILASVLLLPQLAVPLVNVTWTLKCELAFYLIFALLIVERRFLALLILWQAAVLGCLLAGIDTGDGWARYYIGPMDLEFGLGMACAVLVMRRGALPARLRAILARPAPLLAGLLVGTLLFAGGALLERYWISPLPVPAVAVYGIGGGLIILTMALLDLSGRLPRWRLLVYLGDASYSIYLVHFSVITLLSGALLRVGTVPMGTAVYLAVATAGVLAGIAFHRLVDQPIQRALRRLRPRPLAAAAGPPGENASVAMRHLIRQKI